MCTQVGRVVDRPNIRGFLQSTIRSVPLAGDVSHQHRGGLELQIGRTMTDWGCPLPKHTLLISPAGTVRVYNLHVHVPEQVQEA